MQLRLTLHFVSLFRREAPYASRLSAKSKHFVVLAFCFQKSADIFCMFFGFSLNELCAIIFCKIFRGGKFDRLYGYFIV